MDDIDDRIRRELERREPAGGGLERTVARARRRQRNQRLLAGFTAAAIAIGGAAFAIDAFDPTTTPTDRSSSDPRCLSEDEPGLISCQDALRRADEEEGRRGASSVDARLRDYRSQPGAEPVRAWVVTYHDVKTVAHGGVVIHETTPRVPHCQIGDWDVVIDARTGEFLVAGTGANQRQGPCPSDPPYSDTTCRSEDEPGLISCQEALRRAHEEEGQFEASSVDARLDHYRRQPGADPVRVWVVTYHDVREYASGPAPGPGASPRPPNCRIGDWDVGIDALTGAFLGAGTGAANQRPCTPEEATGSTELPDVASIVCDEAGNGTETTVQTPVIQPQPDGVHFQVDNRTPERLSFGIDSVGGTNADPGVHEVEGGLPWSIPPGTIWVRCLTRMGDHGSDEGWVPITIWDPQGLWVPHDLDCPYQSVGIAFRAEAIFGDPEEIARDRLANTYREGDELRRAGYPAAPSPTYVHFRDDVAIAVVEVEGSAEGGWLPSTMTTCSAPPTPWDELSFGCNERGTHTRDGETERRDGGVIVQIDNPLNRAVEIQVEGVGTAEAPPGLTRVPYPPTGELRWPIPAGTVRVRCVDELIPFTGDDPDGWHEAEIVQV